MMANVEECGYLGLRAIRLTAGSYQAVVLPDIGANLISFRDIDRGLSFLREPTPDEMPVFLTTPTTWGIPVLFPPNRIEDGTFTIGNMTYHFPINEESRQNHLHGFLHNTPWTVEDSGRLEGEAFVRLAVHVDETHPAYQIFPHPFQFTLEYRVTCTGLRQTADVVNLGHWPMPFMLGFHTAIRIPFSPLSTERDYVFTATIGRRWELNHRMLPTGACQTLNGGEARISGEGIYPFFEPMDNHYTASPQNGRNYVTVTDKRFNLRLVYDAGLRYRHWMIWNNNAEGRFFCPEPQTNLVNAPNAPVPPDASGLLMLSPGERWTETSILYVEDVEGPVLSR
ncbi:aldose 1-epimerase [Alicyclobacillus macrosporangiidus]|uniref:Aldose 1-epimerase n=2 Tax=Alicyclobacillus macrosporangiidus TaxID=392015 RepID=A0A1I7GA40_9BACL|nr:aldose 1-epimerase [Alicyclobacillus macrosporangiidus]